MAKRQYKSSAERPNSPILTNDGSEDIHFSEIQLKGKSPRKSNHLALVHAFLREFRFHSSTWRKCAGVKRVMTNKIYGFSWQEVCWNLLTPKYRRESEMMRRMTNVILTGGELNCERDSPSQDNFRMVERETKGIEERGGKLSFDLVRLDDTKNHHFHQMALKRTGLLQVQSHLPSSNGHLRVSTFPFH